MSGQFASDRSRRAQEELPLSQEGRVIRRPQSTLVAYPSGTAASGSPSLAVYKLSQRDVLRVEQAAETPLEFVAQFIYPPGP